MATVLTGVTARLSDATADIVDAAIERFGEVALDSAARVLGGPTMRLHTRRGRVPVKLSTRANVSRRGDTVIGFVNGSPAGPWVWLEDGTRAHVVGRRPGTFLKGPDYGHPIRGPIEHPGARGQQVWSRAVDAFAEEYPEVAIKVLKKKVSRG